ncbi:MAG TPA: MarR family winged helix-turn-helix transcriptional regulator [Streptosporangiaceae bacterium]|jgi:DNA-binding MarR family transcriptional regulator
MDLLTAEETRLWHAWKRASETVRARIAEDINAATGLSDPDFGILTRLIDLGGGTLRQNELAASMGWHRSRLSHQLTRMEQRGLLTRSPAGGGVNVTISQRGQGVTAAARPVHAAAVRRHLSGMLPPGDIHKITAILENLYDPA